MTAEIIHKRTFSMSIAKERHKYSSGLHISSILAVVHSALLRLFIYHVVIPKLTRTRNS